MAITEKELIKSWFQKGLKPLAVQFHAWMDSYWHKGEKIPTASIDGLDGVLSQKAESSIVNNLMQGIALHLLDDQKHKTTGEQGKLDKLSDDPNAVYATKEELELLQTSSAIVIDVDFTKTDAELDEAAIAVYARLKAAGDLTGKPFYVRFKYYIRPELGAPTRTTLVQCQPFEIHDSGLIRQPTAILSTPIVTRSEIDRGTTQAYAREVEIWFSKEECVFDVITTGTPVSMKSFNLYFFPEGKLPWDWSAYRDTNIGKTITGTLTKYSNEHLFPCDKWDQLKQFITYDRFNENRVPPIFLRTITSGEKEFFKPASIELYANAILGGTRNNIGGFKLSVSNVEEIEGVKFLVEETIDIPTFTGYGSAYTYKFTITPVRPRVEVVTEYPADLSGYSDGDIIIKTTA